MKKIVKPALGDFGLTRPDLEIRLSAKDAQLVCEFPLAWRTVGYTFCRPVLGTLLSRQMVG